MESAPIVSVIIASLICGTITIGIVAQAWASARSGGRAGRAPTASLATRLDALEERLYRLEQAVDTVALEVERGSEAQRFTAKLLAERLEALPATRVSAHAAES